MQWMYGIRALLSGCVAAPCKFRKVSARTSGLLSLPVSARKITSMLRFRLDCLKQLSVVQGRHDNIPREQRFCRHCPFHVVK